MVASIPPGVKGLLGLATEAESWKDRLTEAAYTSPTGTRIKFQYDELKREVEKRTTEFSFPGVDNSYVQENGFGSRRYPLKCIFWGKDCDRLATAFEAALLEPGIGKLEHPLYGTINVLPFGAITRSDDVIREANVSTVEVTFWTTTGAIYPEGQSHPQSEILKAIDGFDVAAAQEFAESTNLLDQVQQASTLASVRAFLRDISATIEAVSDKVSAVNQKFRDIQSTLNYALDVLVGQPLQLAQQVTNLIRAPARALMGITDRLDAYAALANRIMSSFQAAPDEALDAGAELTSRTVRIANDFHLADLFAAGAVASIIVALVADTESDEGVASAQFASRQEALAAADVMLTQVEALTVWRDRGFRALSGTGLGAATVDTGTAYQALQQAAATAAGYLIELSFSLQPERVIELERETTIINLAAELYGSVEDQLDVLINTNELTGSEILELGRGRRIVYYST